MSNQGFTLIEVIIYITLFALLMGSAFIIAYQLIQGSGDVGTKNTVQEEGNFVLRKINWALTGVQTITTPSSGTTHNLKLTKYDGTKVEICINSSEVRIHEGTFGSCADADYLPLTTENVVVSDLDFEFIAPVSPGPAGIKATARINGLDFIIAKYQRK